MKKLSIFVFFFFFLICFSSKAFAIGAKLNTSFTAPSPLRTNTDVTVLVTLTPADADKKISAFDITFSLQDGKVNSVDAPLDDKNNALPQAQQVVSERINDTTLRVSYILVSSDTSLPHRVTIPVHLTASLSKN